MRSRGSTAACDGSGAKPGMSGIIALAPHELDRETESA